MRYIYPIFLLVLFYLSLNQRLTAQTISCGPEPVVDTFGFEGSAFFNFGSTPRGTSQKYRSAFAVGQTFVGYMDGLMNNSTLGFYSRFLLAPFALKVTATQGDLLDRIQLSWEIDALGHHPTTVSIFIATVFSWPRWAVIFATTTISTSYPDGLISIPFVASTCTEKVPPALL